MTTKRKKQLYWDVSHLQELAVELSIFPKLPSLVPIVLKEGPDGCGYYVDETRLPKELMSEFREFTVSGKTPLEKPIAAEDMDTLEIEIQTNRFPESWAPIVEK